MHQLFKIELVTFGPLIHACSKRATSALVMLTNFWLSLTSQTLSVPQHWLLPVLVSDMRLVLPQKQKGSGLRD